MCKHEEVEGGSIHLQVTPFMVSNHGGTGVGVILGMQAVPGALTVLEGLYLVHLEKGKEMQAFIEPCLQRDLTAPEPRAAPCHEWSTWSHV